MSDFATFCDMIQASLDNPTPQVKQEVLRLLIKEIIVGDDMVTIKHIIPVDDFSRLLPRDSCHDLCHLVSIWCIISGENKRWRLAYSR
jgi:hypothetical protein